MILIRIGAGQGFRIRRDFHGFEAGIAVDVLRHLQLSADEAAVCVRAVCRVFVENDLRLLADQNRPVAEFRPAGIGVGVERDLRQGAPKGAVGVITGSVVGVHHEVGVTAGDRTVFVQAALTVNMEAKPLR